MFTSSWELALIWTAATVLVPIIPWVLFIWLLMGNKIQWTLLYILGWFAGNGVLAFSLLNFQFIHLGISIWTYLLLVTILLVLLQVKKLIHPELKTITTKNTWLRWIRGLRLTFNHTALKESFQSLSSIIKGLTIISSIFVVIYWVITFLWTVSFPSYFDDSYTNWHKPVVHILEDWEVTLFWEKEQILARSRLGYPIHIPIVKASISQFTGGWNEIYWNLWQWFIAAFFVIFLTYETYRRKKNTFLAILPALFIFSIPLLFFHITSGLLDLASSVYAVLSVWSFYVFLENKDYSYLTLWVLFGSILSYIKNDGFIVYFPGIILGFLSALLLWKQFLPTIKNLFGKERKYLYGILCTLIYFYSPFLFLKFYHGLGYNQAQGNIQGIGLSNAVNWEIFSQYNSMFFGQSTYWVILILLIGLTVVVLFKTKKEQKNVSLFILATTLFIFLIFTSVFLFTDNAQFVLNQQTVNRVYVMTFVILLSFSWLLLDENEIR